MSVQVVASDSRMIVFVLADGQSPAIRNDNLQFSVSNNYNALQMKALIQDMRLKIQKIRRAKRIKRIKASTPPYLKKDFGVELNFKLWTTKGARFAASDRNKKLNSLSYQTIGYLSAYLIIINLINVYDLPYLSKMSSQSLGFWTTALSILILIFSQFENAKNYSIKSEKYHQCGLEIAELYNKLRMIKTFENVNDHENEIRKISEEYDIALKKYENHAPIDLKAFTTTKPKYFKLSRFCILKINIEKYFKIKFKYHLMIYGPIILFIYYQTIKK